MKASVIVCTRNRNDNVVSTVEAVLKADFPDFELIICDQSDNDDTEIALAPFCAENFRLKYYRLPLPGKPRALNFGSEKAEGQILLYTDDDCEPEANWISQIVALFEENPKVGCVFTTVTAAPHDPARAKISDCLIPESVVLTDLRGFSIPTVYGVERFGIGASMALRRTTLQNLGGWDPCIGPGAKFPCADDHDMAARVLMAGWHIYLSNKTSVMHYGLRSWEGFGQDIKRAGFANGASFAKHLRCGRFYYGPWRRLVRDLKTAAIRALTGKRPLEISGSLQWAKGFKEGWKHPIHKETRCFRDVSDEESLRWGDQFAQIILRRDQTTKAETTDAVNVIQ